MVPVLLATACNKGIDPITYVAPGNDAAAPVITLIYPTEGTQLQVPDLVTSIDIQFIATDDIELKSVTVSLDGTELVSYSSFKDYRRAVESYTYDNVTNGAHVLEVKATDLTGKVTTATVHFSKKPPYVPVYDGEIFYMPFDGDYMDKISFVTATKVGNPGFASTGFKGTNAYLGATDSYLTFPTTNIKSNEFSAAFWYKLNASPDRSGILNTSPVGEDRTKGFRLFREGDATSQRIKLNVGTGTTETWNDGDVIAAPTTKWVHVAFTVSSTSCIIYINGAVAREVANTGLDWTGCDLLSIGSGAPNFTYWSHLSDLSQYDELRLFNKAISQAEIQSIIANDSPYVPKYSGEIFYMPFEGKFNDLVSGHDATKVGTPGFAAGKVGQAYAGATDAYITFPTTDLIKTNAFSAVFWMKVNAAPDRAGILVMSPPDLANPNTPNNRTSGFRFFREGSATAQIFKLNAGDGTADSWFDGGASATLDPTPDTWNHFAFTISGTECVVYINGKVAKQGTFTGISWTGCDLLSIMSGAPRFTEWSHLSDLSLMDELRIFNKALTRTEVQTIMNSEK